MIICDLKSFLDVFYWEIIGYEKFSIQRVDENTIKIGHVYMHNYSWSHSVRNRFTVNKTRAREIKKILREVYSSLRKDGRVEIFLPDNGGFSFEFKIVYNPIEGSSMEKVLSVRY